MTACQPPEPLTEPYTIESGTTCALDGMLLMDYPGPKAQIHFAGQSTPDFFCDTVEMFNVLLNPEQIREVKAVYVQDMGIADWITPKDAWIDARTAFYVSGSRKAGSMGTTFASFAKQSDAEAFVVSFGGEVLTFDQFKADMARLDGGALHDTRM